MATPARSSRNVREFDWQLIRQLPNFVRLYWRLFRDARTSIFAKSILVAGAAYVVLPFDFVPDVLPFIGQVDDLVIFLGACKAFMYLCPRAVVKEHVDRIAKGR